MHEAWALSPLEGRYASYVKELRPYLSEAAFFLYRLRIETAYLRELTNLPLPPLKEMPVEYLEALERTYESRIDQIWLQLKSIEQHTRHDVKAIEYFLREQWAQILPPSWHHALAFIHFGLTSQDINTTAQALMQRDALHEVYLPRLKRLIHKLHGLAYEWREQTMLSFTHGQPASPTTLGKELYVFVARLNVEYEHLAAFPFWTKLGGAVGNLNAHYFAYPEIDWEAFFDQFAQRLGLKRFSPTTQILPYERWAEVWDSLRRLQAVLIDLAQDLWLYAHRGYLQIQRAPGQIGSSTMPHKSNPIQFELAEGNLRLSNLLWGFFSEKLPVSRLQRDLTDSTILRNLGVALGYGLVGILALEEGLARITLNPNRIEEDLRQHPEVLAEAWQVLQRREGTVDAYEVALRQLEEGSFVPPTDFAEYRGRAPSYVKPPSE